MIGSRYRFRLLADGGIYDQHDHRVLGWIDDVALIEDIWKMRPSEKNRFLAKYLVDNNICL